MNLTASSSSTVPFPANQPTPSAPVRDREAPRRFLRLLDPSAANFTFQTFDDDRRNGHGPNGALARDTSNRDEVRRLYALGAGVFVTINATDLTGRKSENIKRVRAIWQEDDKGHGGPFPLDPSLVIESSPGHFHRYWFIADNWPADEQGRADFAAVMERMVESYGCDKNAKDICRVLRVPGFLHRKDPTQPHLVRIVADSGRRYTREEIMRAFPPVEHERQTRSEWRAADCDEERIADALRAIPADDRGVWLQVGMALKAELGDRGRPVWDHWSATCREKFKDRDQDRTWRSFRRNGIGIGTLFHHAQRHGWSPLRHNTAAPQSGLRSTSVASIASVAWPRMENAAFHGLVGEIVEAISPHTESDPVAILLQVLTFFGNAIGRAPFFLVEADNHRANLYTILVGDTGKARKGTSGGRARSVFTEADPQWIEDRIRGGLSSGEGFIDPIRDEIKRWDSKGKQFEVIDPGVTDKRLMIVEPEFAGALAAMERPGNTLSPMVRKAWDGHNLATMVRHSPLKVTGPHVSIIGHITEDELRAALTRTEAANGFANRFLFACVRRSKELPHGGNLAEETISALAKRVAKAVEHARAVGRVTMTKAAREKWEAVYSAVSSAQPGLLGAVTARAEAQAVRLALIYALFDDERRDVVRIDEIHLRAALAVWEYCEASASRIFGSLLGDPVADEILLALRQAGTTGMTRTAIRDLFGRHRSADRIGVALGLLLTKGRARPESRTTGGRPVEIWFAANA
jgi:hypothetical protein